MFAADRSLDFAPSPTEGRVRQAAGMTDDAQRYWDAQASTFDDDPDHGLQHPKVRRAWSDLLLPLLPPAPASVIDLGCGTGSLSVLLAEAGHDVHGVDLSPAMLEVAQAKATAAGVPVRFTQADISRPPAEPESVDVVLARHVLWALPSPAEVLSAWIGLLKPTGRLLLIEGRWSTGGGLTSQDCQAMVRRHGRNARVEMLVDPALWGQQISDERYLVVSSR